VSFAPSVLYDSGGADVQKVVVADMNKDGIPDLVVLNRCQHGGPSGGQCSQGEVAVLLGVGDGTFKAPVSYLSGGYQAHSMAVADFNGDGDLDVVVIHEGISNTYPRQATIGTLYGNGDGTLQPVVSSTPGGEYGFSITSADFDQDGRPDFVTLSVCKVAGQCTQGSFIQTFLSHDSSSSFTMQPWGEHFITAADLNGDGRPDLIVSSGGFFVLLQNADGTFKPAVSYNAMGSAAFAAIGDVNGDHIPDVVLSETNNCTYPCNNSQIVVFLGKGDGTFGAPQIFASNAQGAYEVTLADLNGDGKLDVVQATQLDSTNGNQNVIVFLGNGDGTFQAALPFSSEGHWPSAVAVADLNHDGKPDIVTGNSFGTSTSSIYSSVGVLINGGGSTTTTGLTSGLNPSVYGQVVTFTAKVTPLGGGGTPSGTVTFYDGTNAIGVGTLAQASATFTTATLAVGAHSITASYSGDSFFVTSTSGAVSETVKQALSTTAIAASPNPAYVGQSVSFTATVTGQYGGAATGTITFKQGATVLTTVPVAGNGAVYKTTYAKVGTNPVVALYSGDANLRTSSSKAVSEVVQAYATATALKASPSPAIYGQSVTLTATVTSNAPGGVTGTVTFKSGATVLGSATLSGGTASLKTTKLAVGSDSLTVAYNGDVSNAKSTSAALAEMVKQATIKMTLASSPNPSVLGHAVKLTATLTSDGGLPTGGTVTFTSTSGTLGTAKVGATGLAVLSVTTLPHGADVVTATYAGDAGHSSASASVTQTVN
jgi:hypothetical protein